MKASAYRWREAMLNYRLKVACKGDMVPVICSRFAYTARTFAKALAKGGA